MKKLVLVALATSGILLCQSNQTTTKLSGFEREALETQSPRVHPPSKHKSNKHRTDRVVADKHTVNAFIPYGK